MIVRDSSETLRPCLEGIRPWVAEMIVVDTGSRDDTREIAKEYGARVFEFPWCDDFSAARNESIRHARGEWLFWMDADDTINEDNGQKLKRLSENSHDPEVLAYVVKVRCPGSDGEGTGGFSVVDHVKLFRNHPRVRFEFRIHEQNLPAIRRLGGKVKWTDIYVVHSGADITREGKKKKCDRDLRILEKELRDRPNHPFALFNLGMTYADMQRHREAIDALVSSLKHSGPSDSQVRKTYAILVNSYHQLGDLALAWETCLKGLELFPVDSELLFRRGILAHDRGDLLDAEHAFRDAMKPKDDEHFSSIDSGIEGYKSRHKLALVYQDMHRTDLAETQWWQAIEEAPFFQPAWWSLGQMLVDQGKLVTATVQAETMMANNGLRCGGMVLTAAIAEARGDFDAARVQCEMAIEEYPGREAPLRSLCRLLFERFAPDETAKALCELIGCVPNDAAAHRNLGLIYSRIGGYESAAASLRESLRIRPDSPSTWEELADTLETLGKNEDAGAARHEAARCCTTAT